MRACREGGRKEVEGGVGMGREGRETSSRGFLGLGIYPQTGIESSGAFFKCHRYKIRGTILASKQSKTRCLYLQDALKPLPTTGRHRQGLGEGRGACAAHERGTDSWRCASPCDYSPGLGINLQPRPLQRTGPSGLILPN